MPQIKKQISVALISLMFLLFIVPLVSANSETFTIPKNGNHRFPVDLNKDDYVQLTATVSWATLAEDESILFNSISLDINDPNGNSFRNYRISYASDVNSNTFAFSAPVTGSYLFNFRDTSFITNSSKTVTLTSVITSYQPISASAIIGVIVVIALATIVIVVTLGHTMKKRQKEILENANISNPTHSSIYDAMLEKRALDIIALKDCSNISWEDSKQRGLLLRYKSVWLSNTELFYDRSYFPISNMAEAFVNQKNMLTIKFRNGEIKEFKMSPDSYALELTNKLAVLNKEFANDTFKAYLKARSQQWADAINNLIHEKLESETVTCKYCGSKNKDTDAKCTYCGANL